MPPIASSASVSISRSITVAGRHGRAASCTRIQSCTSTRAVECAQAVPDRLGPRVAATAQHVEPVGDRREVVRREPFVAGREHDGDAVDAWMPRECGEGVEQQRMSGERRVLLRQCGTETAAAARRRDQRDVAGPGAHFGAVALPGIDSSPRSSKGSVPPMPAVCSLPLMR
jgi:hypothetical protein